MVYALSRLSRLKTTSNSIRTVLLAASLIAGTVTRGAEAFTGPVNDGIATQPANKEASGLAASQRTPGLLWTHNDSGGDPVLFGFAAGSGEARGRIRIEGVKNTDWEDVVSFRLDGRAWLLIADVGDNFARRADAILHVIEEPDTTALQPGQEITLRPVYSIPFVYEDGARDCESVAVDVHERMVYLLSKRDVPARLYRLPLSKGAANLPATARRVGQTPHLPQPDAGQRLVQMPRYALLGMPTAMDFSPQSDLAAVLIYGGLLVFPRTGTESWADALARPPIFLADHRLPQAEAVCFSADGRHLYVTSEKTGQVVRYDRP